MEQNRNKDLVVCLITGPAGAGKSSVSKELAKKFEKSAVIDVDYVYSMIMSGRVKPWPWNDEAKIQSELSNKNACMLANNFLDEGFNVIINDVIGSQDFKFYSDCFKDKKFKVFVLLPTLEALLDRFDKRGGNDDLRKRTHDLHERFTTKKDQHPWHVIDSSNQTLEETTDYIFSELTK